MKRTGLTSFIMAAGLTLASLGDSALPPFHQELASGGVWFKLEEKAWVWQPTAALQSPSWQPYVTAGNWTRHEDNWFWASDYAWGGIAFHYGRWLLEDTHGWIWVPGTQWCPAWVDWKATETHSGWAPMMPEPDFFTALGTEAPAQNPNPYVFVSNGLFLTRQIAQFVASGGDLAETADSTAAGPDPAVVGGRPAVVTYVTPSPALALPVTETVEYQATTVPVVYETAALPVVYETVTAPIVYETAPRVVIRQSYGTTYSTHGYGFGGFWDSHWRPSPPSRPYYRHHAPAYRRPGSFRGPPPATKHAPPRIAHGQRPGQPHGYSPPSDGRGSPPAHRGGYGHTRGSGHPPTGGHPRGGARGRR